MFNQFKELKKLHLQHNSIAKLPDLNTFRYSKFIGNLNIENNPLDFLEIGCTLSATGKMLDCSNLDLSDTINLMDVPIVESMDFSNNNITDINYDNVWGKSNFKDLTTLKLDNNYLGPNIDGYIEMLRNLETLTLDDNQINTLKTTQFIHNPKLKHVTMNNNPLDFLQSGCTLSIDASELNCNNKLAPTATHLDFQHLPSATIQHMDFSNNNVVTLNKNIWKSIENVPQAKQTAEQKGYAFHYRPLEKVQLQNNNISSLGNMFQELSELKKLYTYGNPIALPYPSREEIVGNNTKLTETQMGFCYQPECRYMDVGCQVDRNPPRKVLGTMGTPHSLVGEMTPSNPNFVTIGPKIPKLIVDPTKITVTVCRGSVVEVDQCEKPRIMVSSLRGGRTTIFAVGNGDGFINGDKIQINVDQFDCEHVNTNSQKQVEPCVPTDFVNLHGQSVNGLEITFDDSDLEKEGLLDCSNKGIVGSVNLLDVPLFIQRLHLNTNKITDINPSTWRNGNMEELWLQNNQLTNVMGYTSMLPRLETLNLDNNKLTFIHPNQFMSLPFLRDVSLLGNDGIDFISKTCTLSSNGRELRCNGLGLTGHIDMAIPELEYLDFSDNSITSFNYNMWDHSNASLKTLKLNHNELTDIKDYTTNLGHLEQLFLNNNKINHLSPDQFVANKVLYLLNIENNELDFQQAGCILSINGKALDCNRKNLTGFINFIDIPSYSVTKMDFGKNSYCADPKYLNQYECEKVTPEKTTFPGRMWTANSDYKGDESLGELSFKMGDTIKFHSKIDDTWNNGTFLDTIGRFRHDKTISEPIMPETPVPGKISYKWTTGIAGLGKEMWHPYLNRDGSLEELYIHNNEISNITGYTNGLSKLRVFEAGFNHLVSITPLQFQDNVQLEKIGLSFNKIQRIHKELFSANKHLHSLNLFTNEIDSLAYKQFQTQTSLSKLFLGNNRMKTLEMAEYKMEQVPVNRSLLETVACSDLITGHQIAFYNAYGGDLEQWIDKSKTTEKECEDWWPTNASTFVPHTGCGGLPKMCEQTTEENQRSLVITKLVKTNCEVEPHCPFDLTYIGQATVARLTYCACE